MKSIIMSLIDFHLIYKWFKERGERASTKQKEIKCEGYMDAFCVVFGMLSRFEVFKVREKIEMNLIKSYPVISFANRL